MDLRSRLADIEGSVVVVGGANTDIVGLSEEPLVAEDSNPGHIRVSAGGVGRNIAENLALLGAETQLVTAFGSNPESKVLRTHCEAAGIDVTGSLTATDLPGPRYLAIADETGDMALAVSDMRALVRITPDYLAFDAPVELLSDARLVVVDANISPDTLGHIASTVTVPIVADTVSVAKTPRLAGIAEQLAALKTNPIEAAALLGVLGTEGVAGSDAPAMATALVAAGIERVFISQAEKGCVLADSSGVRTMDAGRAGPVIDTTGAGDSFTAGLALALLAGATTAEAAALGSAIAARTVAVEFSVNPEPDLAAIIDDAEELLA
jgi:pseudouridine kinase